MDLSIYNVIVGAHMTSKAYRLNQDMQQLVLDVHPKANKPMIVEALKKLFNVEAKSVRIIISQSKRRRSGRFVSKSHLSKKAYISLLGQDAAGLSNLASAQGAPMETAAMPQETDKE